MHGAQRERYSSAENASNTLMPEAHTENGVPPESSRAMSKDIPASLGVRGPGEITIALGLSLITSATLTSSFLTTSVDSPSLWIYRPMLKTKES